MTKFDISESDRRVSEDHELSLKEIIFIIRKHLGLIVLISSIVFLISVIYTLSIIPEYRSSTMVEVAEQSQTLPMFDIGLDVGSNVMLNEVEKLKSRTLAEEVVNRLWNSQYRNNLFVFGTRTYKPDGLRKPVRKLLDSIFNSQQNEFLSNAEDTISDSLFNNAIRTIRQSIAVSNERKTNILNISMTSNDPQEAALLANAVATTYQQRDMEWSTGEINNLSKFLEKQLKEVESDLGVVENELRQFQEQEKIYELKGNAQLVLAQLGDVEKKYNTAKASISIIQERKRYINSKLSQEEKTLTNQLLNSINSKLIALRDEIALSEGNLIRNISLYGEDHEAVVDLKQNIDQLKVQLEQQTNQLIAQGTSVADPINYRQSLMDTILYLEAREANYYTQAQEYNKLVNRYERELTKLPAKSLRFAQMERDRTVLAETYSLMRTRFD